MAQSFRTFNVVILSRTLYSLMSLPLIVLFLRRLHLASPSLFFVTKYTDIFHLSLRGKSPCEWQVLATCSSIWSPPFNFNKTVLVPCSGMLVWSKRERHERWRLPCGGMHAHNHLHALLKSGTFNFKNTASRQLEKYFNIGKWRFPYVWRTNTYR